MRIVTVLFAAHILLISTGCSQTNKIEKGYAYARAIISGVKPKVSVAENSTIIQKNNEPGIQYFIYFETKDTSFLPVKNIWIKGKKYNAKPERVYVFPVVLQKNIDASSDTLVKATGKFITWKINVDQVQSSSDSGITKRNQFKNHDVIISFLYKGRMYYFSIPKIKYLEPIRLQ